MDRRNFFKIVSAVSAGVATTACGNKSDALIPLLVPNHEIAPGEEQWHPSVCTECGAGCGIIARVMEGERIIERNGEKFRERIACMKKIEGNPLDPVSGGRLCARGQAALQSLYNPDRVSQPMRRTSARGNAEFTPISWDEAIATVADKLAKAHSADPSKILFLTTPQPGSRSLTIQRFLQSLGAPPALTCSLADFALERKAAASVFGWKGLPRYDLGNARYVLGVGADFLGGWTSPVYYAPPVRTFPARPPWLARQAGPGRIQNVPHRRQCGRVASACVPVPSLISSSPLRVCCSMRNSPATRNSYPQAFENRFWRRTLLTSSGASGIDEKRLRRIARELGESEAPLVIAGASIVHTNSLDALVAAHYLNLLLGNIGRPGGVFPPNPSAATDPENANVPEALKRAQILLLDEANPVYTLPAASGIAGALAHTDTIVSFGMFIDDSAAYADVILPSPHPLGIGNGSCARRLCRRQSQSP